MNLPWKKKAASALGVSFDGSLMRAALLRQNGVRLRLLGQTEADLALDPWKDNPADVGAALKVALDHAELREKQCVVGIPIEWMLTNTIDLPALDEEDIQDYLDMQIERSFPFSPSDLAISISRFQAALDDHHALVTAVQNKHIERLGEIMKAAGLKPVGYSLPFEAIQRIQEGSGSARLILHARAGGVSLMASTARGDIAILRALKDVTREGGAIEEKALAREIRVTLGQLPAGLREGIEKIEVCGKEDNAQELVEALKARATALGLGIEAQPAAHVENGVVAPPLSGTIPAPVALAASQISNPGALLDYLPPHVTPWERLLEQAGSRKLGTSAAILGAFTLIVLVAFLWQGRTLSRLESKWDGMKAEVQALDKLNGKASRFRSWYESSQPNLQIFLALAQAFPEDGAVTARNIEISDREKVTCTGVAGNQLDVMDVVNRLRKMPQVQDLRTQRMSGTSPVQFTFEYRWDASRRAPSVSS